MPRRDAFGKCTGLDILDKKKMAKYYTYILKSEKCKKYYYGHTKDLVKRVKQHNAGRVRSTKSCKPWKIHYVEEFDTKSEAYKREMFFKSIEGYKFLRISGIIDPEEWQSG